METQSQQLQLFTGAQLRDSGMRLAEDHANEETIFWSFMAYRFLLKYALSHEEFMIEDVREASKGIVPEPTSLRAWGGIAARAAKKCHIYKVGYRPVTNAKAHCTPAALWRKL